MPRGAEKVSVDLIKIHLTYFRAFRISETSTFFLLVGAIVLECSGLLAATKGMASHSLGLGATLLSLVSTSLSMQPTNGVQFLFPTQGVTLHYNDYVQVQYTSDFTDPWLFTFCESADGDVGRE